MAQAKTTKKTSPKKTSAAKATAATQTTKPAAKKRPERKPVVRKSAEKPQAAEKAKSAEKPAEKVASKNRSLKLRKSYVIGGLVVILVVALLYLFKGYFVVATVNGQPISRIAFISELEQEYGKQALNTLITKRLIEQAAAKNHVSVSQKEVSDEEKNIETRLAQQGQKLDDALAAQGMTRSMLDDQIRLQKIAEKINDKNITVSDKEINDYIAKNKDSLPQENENDLKKTVKDQLHQQKLNQNIQTWVQNLQNNAKINRFVNY